MQGHCNGFICLVHDIEVIYLENSLNPLALYLKYIYCPYCLISKIYHNLEAIKLNRYITANWDFAFISFYSIFPPLFLWSCSSFWTLHTTAVHVMCLSWHEYHIFKHNCLRIIDNCLLAFMPLCQLFVYWLLSPHSKFLLAL